MYNKAWCKPTISVVLKRPNRVAVVQYAVLPINCLFPGIVYILNLHLIDNLYSLFCLYLHSFPTLYCNCCTTISPRINK